MFGSGREADEELLGLSVDADLIADLMDGDSRGAALISSRAGIRTEKARPLPQGVSELMRLAPAF